MASTWEGLCTKFENKCKNKDALILVNKLKDYMIKLYSTVNEKEYNDTKFILCHRNNITFDVQDVILNFLKYCFEIEIKELTPKLKTVWKVYRQECNRNELFNYIDREITLHKISINKKIHNSKHVIEVETMKEQLIKELEDLRKSHSKLSVEKDKFSTLDKSQKIDNEHLKEILKTTHSDNELLQMELKFTREKFETYEKKNEELKQMNLQLMKIVENMSIMVNTQSI